MQEITNTSDPESTEETRQPSRTFQLAALSTISQAISNALTLDDVLKQTLDIVCDIFGADGAAIWLFEEAKGRKIRHASGMAAEDILATKEDSKWHTWEQILKGMETLHPIDVHPLLAFPSIAQPLVEAGFSCAILIPIMSHQPGSPTTQRQSGDWHGVLILYSLQPDGLAETNPDLLEVISLQMMLGINKAELYETSQWRNRDLEVRNRVSAALSSSLQLDTMLSRAVDAIVEATNFDAAALYLVEASTGDAVLVDYRGIPEKAVRKIARLGPEQGATGRAIEVGQSIVVSDLSATSYLEARAMPSSEIRAFAVVPLTHREQVVGSLNVGAYTPRPITNEDQRLLTSIAQQVGLAIANAKLFAAEKAQRRTADAIRRVSELVSSSLALDEVLNLALTALHQIIPYDSVSVLLRQGEDMIVTAVRGFDEPNRVIGQRIPICPGTLAAAIIQEQEPILIADTRQDPRWQPLPGTERIRAHLSAPLIAKARVIGQFCIDSCQVGRFSERERRLIVLFSQQVANAVENAQLYETVRVKEQELTRQIEESTDAIFNLDIYGRFTQFNRAAEALSGYQRHEIIGRAYTDLICPEHASAFAELALQPIPERGQPLEIELFSKDGERRPIEISATPLEREGKTIGVQIIARDLRDRKRLEELREDFIATVSHDLRTPLASITGFTEVLLGETPGPLTEMQAEFLNIIAEAGQQLLNLVNQVLDVSRLDRGQFRLEREWLEMGSLVKKTTVQMYPLASKKHIQLNTDLPDDIPRIYADGDRISRVISNLLNNAIKFTPDGGDVTISLQLIGAGLECRICDTGIGIPTDDLPYLFSRFGRASNVRRRQIKGTGLGLYISKAIVEAHGGQIGVESVEGKETTFWFTLPLPK